MWNEIATTHGLCAIRDCIHTRDPGRPGRGAYGGVIEAVSVAEPFGCQIVNGRRAGVGPAVTTNPEDAIVLACDP